MTRTPTPIRPPRASADWSDSDSERGDAAAAAPALPPAEAGTTHAHPLQAKAGRRSHRLARGVQIHPLGRWYVIESIDLFYRIIEVTMTAGPPQQLLFTLAYTAPTNTAPPVVPQERGKAARLRLVSRNRMIDSDGVGVVDIEREDDRSQNHVAKADDSMESKDDFVFDVYAFEGPTNSCTAALSSDALYLDFSDLVFDDGNDEDGALDEADEDSNDEDDYRNDYPEEKAEDGDYDYDYGNDYGSYY
ncbi:hypothetical protein DFJ73DRAFT_786214 [Zopfochytrium polystomum]|nr:hypothetical protein DFJ73DRAFT_786214 [Zopfochytrium polystomum]